jgi:hypothetical protein
MAERTEQLRATAAQCLALAQATTDPRTRVALTIMAQKLYDMASDRPTDFEAASVQRAADTAAAADGAGAADAATAANPAEGRTGIDRVESRPRPGKSGNPPRRR